MMRMLVPIIAVISVIVCTVEAQRSIASPYVIVSNRQFDHQSEMNMDRLSERVGAAISNRREIFGNQSSQIREESRLDVSFLLRDVVDTHLPGCHKVRVLGLNLFSWLSIYSFCIAYLCLSQSWPFFLF